VLGGFNDVINRAGNVSEDYAGQVAGGRVLSGTKLQNGLQSMIRKYGADRLESVVGKDGMENMTRMADLLKTQPQSRVRAMSMNVYHSLLHGKVGAAIGIAAGQHLGGYEGAAAGAMIGAKAERAVLRYIATSPRAGQLFDYAVRNNNVTPKLASGLIAAEIEHENEQPEQQPEQ
jgi:outer membrane lipoprotein SlyB